MSPSWRGKEPGLARVQRLSPGSQRGRGDVAGGHDALLAPLAANQQVAILEVVGAQGDQLAHPQASGVEQLQHRVVASPDGRLAVGRGQQVLHLLLTQHARQAALEAWSVHEQGRVGLQKLLGREELEELAEGHPMAGCGA